MKTFYAWHFTANKLRDGSPLPMVGVWEHYPGKLELCKSGLHWSRDPFDALQYAPGANLRMVEINGDFLERSDKGCSHYRRTVYQFDATELLRYFARMQALSVIHLYPNGRDDVVFDYLMTGDESIREGARSSAGDAAGAAERSSAGAAAGDDACAAWSATRASAVAATWSSAGDAAGAAWFSARSSAVAAAWAAAGDAAGAAAGDAWFSAGAAARKMFTELIGETE